MRCALILALIPFPAVAWEFSPDPICTLTHQASEAEIVVTYDADLPEYALMVTLRDGMWPQELRFNLAFYGDSPATLVTGSHSLSDDRATLTVRDTGFGNVLDGIEFNGALAASTGSTVIGASTTDAATAVQAFRACPTETPPLS